ncbi:cytochrome c-type biogenesis protein, partial [Salmonella enterica]|uniref:cytochrome c-type biogenesis protein n=1 Tax=Salmonella enterica TaxID=28901 RepID=UPI001FAEC22D
MRLLPGMVMLMLVLVISGSARATTDVMPFKDEAQEQQFRQLTEQLRCPKCQNNSIADSNAMIATDMRRRVYDLMQEGKSRQEIIDYMVARYGNFVTYDPPLTPLTVLLWVLPLAAMPAQESFQMVEATKGINSYYLTSDGSTMSYRTR